MTDSATRVIIRSRLFPSSRQTRTQDLGSQESVPTLNRVSLVSPNKPGLFMFMSLLLPCAHLIVLILVKVSIVFILSIHNPHTFHPQYPFPPLPTLGLSVIVHAFIAVHCFPVSTSFSSSLSSSPSLSSSLSLSSFLSYILFLPVKTQAVRMAHGYFPHKLCSPQLANFDGPFIWRICSILRFCGRWRCLRRLLNNNTKHEFKGETPSQVHYSQNNWVKIL